MRFFHKSINRRSRALTAKKCTKTRYRTFKVTVLLHKPIAFCCLSLLLKFPSTYQATMAKEQDSTVLILFTLCSNPDPI